MSFFREVICYKCKEPFGIRDETNDVLRRSHQTFYCPFGHNQHYLEGESEETKLRRERNQLKQEQARLHQIIAAREAERDAESRRVIAAKGQITKLKKRSAEGRCPCCNRVFVDLLSHMKSKHADYEAEPVDVDAPTNEDAAA